MNRRVDGALLNVTHQQLPAIFNVAHQVQKARNEHHADITDVRLLNGKARVQIARVGAGLSEHGLVGACGGCRQKRTVIRNGFARQRAERDAAFQRIEMALHHGEHATAGQLVARGLSRYIIGIGAGVAHKHFSHALGVRNALGVSHGARRFVEVHNLFSSHHTARAALHYLVNVAGIIVVGGKRYFTLEIFHRFDVREVVLAPKRRVFVRIEHFEQQLFLYLACVLHIGLELRTKGTTGLALFFEHHAAQRCHVGHAGRRRYRGCFSMNVVGGQLVDSFISRHDAPPIVLPSEFW